MKSLAVSAPYLSMISLGVTTFPMDLDIFLPSLFTMPWVRRLAKGSSVSIIPMSCRTMVKNLEYIRCSMACSTPPIYWSTCIQ